MALQTYTVIYTEDDGSLMPLWQFFLCQAEDADHAEEQCQNAYPDGVVIWVNLGIDYTMEQ